MHRSWLFVPADSERKLAKAESAGADALILDLEDSVLPKKKAAARAMASEYLKHRSAGPDAWVRINDLRSGELLKDLVAVVPARPAGILLPKIFGPEDVAAVALYLDALEAADSSPRPLSIMALVTETPLAVLRMADLARASLPRLTAVAWGAEDLSTAVGAGDARLASGAWRPLYEYARLQCLLSAHAMGIDAIDTVFVDYRDAAGLETACNTSRHDGFAGRLAIHPDQVRIINQAFTVTDVEYAHAQRVVDAFASGAGAVSLDGKMFDIPHLKAAQRLLHSRPAAKPPG